MPMLKSLQWLSTDRMKSKRLCTQETSSLSPIHFVSAGSLPPTTSFTLLFLLLLSMPECSCPFCHHHTPLPQFRCHLDILHSLPPSQGIDTFCVFPNILVIFLLYLAHLPYNYFVSISLLPPNSTQ